MRFRRWVVFAFAIHVLVLIMDKGAGLILTAILRHDPDLKGALDLLSSLPFIMVAVANLGLATSSVYFLRKRKFEIVEVAQTNALVAVVSGGFVAVAALILSQTVLPAIQPEWDFRLAYVVPICLCVPLLLTSSYFNSLQLALDRVKDYYKVHLFSSAIFLPLFFIFFLGFGMHATDSMADARVGAALLVMLITLWMLRDIAKWRPRMHWGFFRAGITYGWKANLTSVFTYLNHRIDLFILAFMVGAPSGGVEAALGPVAFYSLAVSFAELVWHFPESTRDLFFSKVAGATNDEARDFTPILCRLCLLAAAILGVGLWIAIEPVGMLVTGDAWQLHWRDTVVSCFTVLIPGTVAYTVAKVLQADLAGRGHINHALIPCMLVAVVMVSLDFALIPDYGAVGAAYASTIAYVLSAVYTLVAYKHCDGTGVMQCVLPRPADWSYAVELGAAIKEKIRGKKS